MFDGGGVWLGGVEDLFSAGDVTVNLMELVRFCLVQGESTNLDPILFLACALVKKIKKI